MTVRSGKAARFVNCKSEVGFRHDWSSLARRDGVVVLSLLFRRILTTKVKDKSKIQPFSLFVQFREALFFLRPTKLSQSFRVALINDSV